MNRKHKQNIYHANLNVDMMEKIVIQINGGIAIDLGVKNVRHVKKIMIKMLLHVIVKMESI